MQTQTRRTAPLPPTALQAIARIDHALAAPEREIAAKVTKALGFHNGWKPRTELGETPTRILEWTQHELNARYERLGGTVTARQVQRSTDGGDTTWHATEITLTVDLPGIGRIQLITDWDEDSGGRDLPVMQQIADAELIAA
ncbi:hypothetical protein [Streptomyces sp. NPDC018584]|uniref:hypothetical protein n=1 Tax=unclassified Streptomyces TaxID=2593676 RepID=UPI0037AF893C